MLSHIAGFNASICEQRRREGRVANEAFPSVPLASLPLSLTLHCKSFALPECFCLFYSVDLQVNSTHQQMHCAISNFCERTHDHVALIYFSGHAVQASENVVQGGGGSISHHPDRLTAVTHPHHSINVSPPNDLLHFSRCFQIAAASFLFAIDHRSVFASLLLDVLVRSQGRGLYRALETRA